MYPGDQQDQYRQQGYEFDAMHAPTPLPIALNPPVMRSFELQSNPETTRFVFGSSSPREKVGLDVWNLNYQQKVDEIKAMPFGEFDQGFGTFDHFAKPMLSSLGDLDSYLDIQQLEPVPVYYEKYSSFYTPSPPEPLLRDIHRIFNEMEDVDHDLKPSKCKIKGFANGVTGRCSFKVQLFWHQGTTVLCEFQRRSGCVVSFNKFWKKSLGCLKSHAPRLPENNISQLFDFIDCASLPAVFAESTKAVLDRETVDRLVAMAGCDNVDVQREGSAALAAVSQTNSQQLCCCLAQIVPLVSKLMLASDEELCRNGCVFLANLCVAEECREEIVKCLLTNMLNLLSEPGHMGRRDSKRHVARALFECSKAPCGVAALLPHASVLEGYRDTQDSAFQGSIRGMLAHLKVVEPVV